MQGAPSARVIVALFMLIPVLGIAVVLIGLSTMTTSRIAEDLGTQIVERASSAVQERVRDYLDAAVRISELYSLRVKQGELPTSELTTWEPFLLNDLRTSPDVASICFGNTKGDSTWLLRHGNRLELGRGNGQNNNFTQEFPVDPVSGEVDLHNPIRTYQYDPRLRPWYEVALKSNGPLWTPIYFWFGESGGDPETGSGYTRAVHDPQTGDLVGVLVIDVTLAALSDMLRQQPLSETGSILIVDEQGFLVASSSSQVNTSEGNRTQLSRSEDPYAAAAANMLETTGAAEALSGVASIAGDKVRVQMRRFEPQAGLKWMLITVVPERTFLAQAQRFRDRSIIAGIIAIIFALALAIIMARFICNPIIKVRNHARRIGSGDFDSRLWLTKVRELRDLSGDLNQMAVDLKDRMEIRQALVLANEVQQSLLPQSPPRVPGMDMCGYSRYCDQAGGDYFDFVDLAQLPHNQTLIAVGDVMGHGIASALLMATARAALRATALEEGSLGVLMTRVNRVLASDIRHGRFMTMILGVIDPRLCTMRWACAGHDPPIIYSPARGDFRTVSGGDLPLGIDSSITFDEYLVEDIEPGSVIVFGTDGIWEAAAPPPNQAERFGKARLCEVVRKHAHGTAAEIAQQIRIALAEFSQADDYEDDVTFVVVKLWLAT